MTDTLFKWDDSFLIGIEELDHEHKVLIDDINRLHEELDRQGNKSGIEQCVVLALVFIEKRVLMFLHDMLLKREVSLHACVNIS